MNKQFAACVAAAALVLAGCGGGAESTGDGSGANTARTRSTAQAAAGGLRALSAAGPVRMQAVSAEAAAEQLFNFAEQRFPAFFPAFMSPRPATQSLAPFRFRAYPNGVYLGVATSASDGYVAHGVYVMGGAFGAEPLYVGLVSDFIVPFDPDSDAGPAGPNNGCVDLAAVDQVGHTILATYQNSGAAAGTSSMEMRVMGPTSFEGHEVIESVAKTKTDMVLEGRPVTTESETRSYYRRTGDAEITEFGHASPATASPLGVPGVFSSSRTVYTPPFVDRVPGLATGQSLTQTRVGIATSLMQYPGLPDSKSEHPLNITTTTTFVGVESVTVPAGTFSACRLQITTPGSAAVTSWQHRGSGVMLKFQGPMGTSEATSVLVNGVALASVASGAARR